MPKHSLITLTTDFGEGSRYVAAMKGAILSINPAATIVDLTHSVPPQDIAYGARVLAETVPHFPAEAIHVAVIDPGVGSDRLVLYVELGAPDQDAYRLVLPDNGLTTNLAARANPRKIVAITQSEYWSAQVSPTFHGRDIMAPVAAHLSLGLAPDKLGPPRRKMLLLDVSQGLPPEARRVDIKPSEKAITSEKAVYSHKEWGVGQKIEGEVIEVDSFGNLITNITQQQLEDCPRDSSVSVRCDEHETVGIQQTYADQPPMTLVALVGSGGNLELAIVDDSAKIMLGVTVGTPVTVSW